MKVLLLLLTAAAADPTSTPPAPTPTPNAPAPTSPASANAPENGAPGAAVDVNAPAPTGFAAKIGEAFAKLDASKNACSERDLGYDYWPHGGLRNFWCHAQSAMPWRDFVAAVPMDIFLKGPHTKTKLALHDAHDFGRYNPAFVRWLVDNAIPAHSDVTQPIFDKYVRELARAYYRVHVAMSPTFIKKERELYLHTMDEKKPDWASFYDRYSEFLGDADHNWGGVDPNLQSASVAFWLRRDVDGTAPLFFEGLKKLLRAYDADWLRTH